MLPLSFFLEKGVLHLRDTYFLFMRFFDMTDTGFEERLLLRHILDQAGPNYQKVIFRINLE